jgi:hypothetical protein
MKSHIKGEVISLADFKTFLHLALFIVQLSIVSDSRLMHLARVNVTR